jgi:hypothetical protein
VHLVVFHYKNISRCTVLWMSNPINSLPFCFKIQSIMIHLRLGLLIVLSSCFYSLLSGRYLKAATTMPFPISSHCARVVASYRHCKTNVQLCWRSPKTCSLYVWILSVSSAATISTPFIAVLCLNAFLIILIISYYPSTRKLFKLLRVLTRLMTSFFSNLSGRW